MMKQFTSLRRAALLLLTTLLTATTAWAQTETVTYIDGSGNEYTCDNYTVIDEDNMPTTLTAGWYVVEGKVEYTSGIRFEDEANIILADGCNMTVNNSELEAININDDLTIYGQSLGTGKLIANGFDKGIKAIGDITINGGIVTATGKYGIYAMGTITLGGGIVTATGENGYGIYAYYGNITLGGGIVTASSYRGTVNYTCDYRNASGDPIYSSNLSDFADVTLYPDVAVSYLNEDGDTQTVESVDYIILEGNPDGGADLAAGTYLVASDITYNGPLNLDGDVTLILADGATMNIGSDGDERINGHGIKGYDFDRDTGYNLTITSQTAGTGAVNVYVTGAENWAIGGKKLTINGGNITADTDGNSGNAIAAVYNLTINGGNVTANASGNDAQAIASASDITINGGTVNATGDLAGIAATSNVTINGGNVNTTATANADSYGIATNGTITLGWTRATDRIYANSYGGTVSVATADGHKLYDGNGNFLSGTVSDLAAVNGKTLRPAATATYTTADGTTDTADAILLDASDTSLPAGNYLATGTLNYTHRITLAGDVTLILADNCHMNVGTSGERINGSGIMRSNSPTLTITSEANGSGNGNGALSVYTTGNKNPGILANALTINGGNVTADTEGNGCHALRAYVTDITINGGTISATTAGTDAHAICAYGNVNYNGGTVTATAPNGNAIYAADGNYNFSWRTPADRITIGATGLYVKDGKTATFARTMTDGLGNAYTGTIDADGITALNARAASNDGLTLQPGNSLAANKAPDGNYWTTYYNSAYGHVIPDHENACAYTATYADGQLTLHRLGTDGKTIPADCAVIIVADNPEVSMTAATALDDYSGSTNDLRGVDDDTPLANIRSDLGEGTLYVLGMTTVNNEQHFGFHRYTGSEMAAHKAFVLVSGTATARSLTMVFDDASGIESAEADSSLFTLHSSLSSWFTLDGRRLQAKPTAPGIYINNGKKVVIK